MLRQRLVGDALTRYLASITAALVRSLDPRRVILFGSFARGDQNRASDVDLVVIAESPLPFCERIGQALAACYAASTAMPVEVLVYTPKEWDQMVRTQSSFAKRITSEGRILYDAESQPHGRAALAKAGAARP